jgi:hypothetical protein
LSLLPGLCSGLIGLVSGILAIRQIKKKAGCEKGKPIAIADIVLGLLACLIVSYVFTRDNLLILRYSFALVKKPPPPSLKEAVTIC